MCSLSFADVRTDQPGPLFGDINGTNAARYKSVKFTNGSTTNNGDGSVSVSTSGGGGSGTVNSGTANQAARYASTGTAVSGSTLIYDDLTNVGIGTVTPVAVVNISSTANQDLFRVDDNATNDLSPFVINKDGNVGIGTTNTQTDKLLVMGGNVGIGTWVPNQTLDVKGTAIISGNVGIGTLSPAALLSVASTLAQDLVRIDDNGTGDPSPLLIDLNGNVGIGTTLTTTAGLSVMNGNVGIGTWIPTQSLTVNNSINTLGNTGNSYLNSTGGNVGIGSVNPGALLDVAGNIRTSTVSGQSDGILLCVKSGRIGYCSGVVAGISCTCN